MRFFIIPNDSELILIGGGILLLLGGILLFRWLRPPLIRRLLDDPRYLEALSIYLQHLPPEGDPSPADRHTASTAAVDYLSEQCAIPREQAQMHLGVIEGEYLKNRSYELRETALGYEQAGAYDLAAEYFARAAELRKDHDAEDYEFLQRCIHRVHKKSSRQ